MYKSLYHVSTIAWCDDTINASLNIVLNIGERFALTDAYWWEKTKLKGIEVTSYPCNSSPPWKLSPNYVFGNPSTCRIGVSSIHSYMSIIMDSIWEITVSFFGSVHVYFVLDVLLASELVVEVGFPIVTKGFLLVLKDDEVEATISILPLPCNLHLVSLFLCI